MATGESGGSSSSDRTAELFATLDGHGDGRVRLDAVAETLRTAGISPSDPRLEGLLDRRRRRTDTVDLEAFSRIASGGLLLLEKTLRGELVIPDFATFADEIEEIYEQCSSNKSGEVANYIPQLGRVDPEQFGIGLCTVDGQRLDLGDSRTDFCVQSCCKPVNYSLALEEHGESRVHDFIGREPSGRSFNELTLNADGRPHNPMINAGAIMACSLIRTGSSMADRFDFVMSRWRALCGGAKPGFSNSVYLSERQSADRNYALGHMMRERRAFPPDTELVETLEFYFQCCSIEVTAENMAVLAATLANAGVCPITGERIFSPGTVQKCLSLMSSCGMYDFSGEFSFLVGLPAKSGVSGCIIGVVPNVLGFCSWSPRLDKIGNSVRGLELCRRLVERYNFHMYDNLTLTEKKDPRKSNADNLDSTIGQLIWASALGDLATVRQLVARGVSPLGCDYDGRTPLHLAAAENRVGVVRFLLSAGAKPTATDRWGRTPLDEAKEAGDELRSLLTIAGRRGEGLPTEPALASMSARGVP